MRSAIKLESDVSQRVIENAIRTQAQTVLESPAWPETTINAFMISGDQTAVLLEVTSQLCTPVERILNAPCEAQLYCDQRYRFSTVIIAAPPWGNSRSLAIARPKIISVIDRRRFLRAKLAPSTTVKLQWHRAGITHRHVAAMLNISPEGLACRIADGVATDIEVDDVVEARFEFPDLDRQFSLQAVVSNKTPASEGCIILGLHFVRTPEEADQLAALRQAVRDPRTVSADSEVCV
ncbi:MAG: PilZ domain-containing protein [Dehalococcoidia bacterium]